MSSQFLPPKGSRSRWRQLAFGTLVTFGATSPSAAQDSPFTMTYGGRLTQPDGKPITGPVSLVIKFFPTAAGGSPIGQPITRNNVNLENGVFQVDLADLSTMGSLLSGSTTLFIEITDATNSFTYPRQRITAVPYALRVPVDGSTITYDSNGRLKANIATAALAGDVTGTVGATSVEKIKGIPVANLSGSGYLQVTQGQIVLSAGSGGTTIDAATTVDAGTITSANRDGLVVKPYNTFTGNTGELRFRELDTYGTNYVGFKAADVLSNNVVWSLPSADGTNGQVLTTDGAGKLFWTTNAGGESYPVTSVNGRTGAVTISNSDISGLGTLASANFVTGSMIDDNSITDADINVGAAIVDTKLGTISSVGKVKNSATTATSANTVNAIVARDSSGNFSAGNITATLVGNATNVTGTVAIANGGTGATSPAVARSNLGLGTVSIYDVGSGADNIVQLDAFAKLPVLDGTNLTGLVKKVGDTLTGTLYLPGNGLVAGSNQLVLGNGNVGIGSGTPGARLDVATSGAGIQTVERLQNTVSAATNSGAQTMYSANRTTSGLTDVAAIGGMITDISTTAYRGALIFSTANNAAPSERMRIDSNGKVGIGTTMPVYNLDIAGDAARIKSSSGNTVLFLENSTVGINNWSVKTGTAGWQVRDETNDQSRVVVNNSGNVGIGTTTPAANLEVNGITKLNGGVMANSLNVTTGPTGLNGGTKVGNNGSLIAAMGYCVTSVSNAATTVTLSSCSPGALPSSSTAIVMCSSSGSSTLPLSCQVQITPQLSIACSAASLINTGSTIRCLWMQPP